MLLFQGLKIDDNPVPMKPQFGSIAAIFGQEWRSTCTETHMHSTHITVPRSLLEGWLIEGISGISRRRELKRS